MKVMEKYIMIMMVSICGNGEILRIRHLNKVCKDREGGRYLYTGYIQSVPHEHDYDYYEEYGVPICFTIDKRVSDIVQENNPREIRNFLNLLSQKTNFEGKSGEMMYIGALDRAGNILKNDNPQCLWQKIQEVKEEYARSHQYRENPTWNKEYE